MMLGQLVAFAGVCAILTLTPGLDTALVVRNVLVKGRRSGILTALGISLGLYVHATAVALGVATLLERSVTAFTILKIGGAVYLGILGIAALRTSFKRRAENSTVAESHPLAPRWIRTLYPQNPFVQGFLSDVTNPKAFLFFLTFLPQFLTPGQASLPYALLLATIAAVIDFVWLSMYSLVLGRLTPVLQRAGVQRWLNRITGAIFLAFGLHLATESQP